MSKELARIRRSKKLRAKLQKVQLMRVSPYKGKGIFIDGEHIARKERKKAAAG